MTRAALATVGLATLAAAWLGPLPALAPRSFSAHMTMHMAVVAAAAPLLAVSVAGSRVDPAARWPVLFAAIPASVLELLVVWGWHAPALHHAARGGATVFAAEQASFLAAGLLVWIAAVGGSASQRATGAATGIVALLLTSMHMTLLGALLALSPRPLYAHAAARGGEAAALHDQHLGGAIMLLVGGAAYLAGGLWLAARLVAERRAAVQAPTESPWSAA
jgi:putative membrane protein